jgi:AraC-like DNA-binding protein
MQKEELKRPMVEDVQSGKILLPHTHISVDDCSGQDRFEKWRENMSGLYDVEAEKSVRDDNFYAYVDACVMDSIMLVETQTRQMDWYRTPLNIANDGMDHLIVQIFLDGDAAFMEGRDQNVLPTGGIQIKSLSETAHTISSDFKNFAIVVKRDLVDPWLKDPMLKAVHHPPANSPLVKMLRNHMLTLRQLLPTLSVEEGKLIAPQTVGMITACLNGHLAESQEATSGVSHAQIVYVKTFIEENLGNRNLSPSEIARLTGASRSKLYRIFETLGGVAGYVRERRLKQAVRRLNNSRYQHRPVYDIALESGFENAGTFSRLFKERYGLSPSEYRKHALDRKHVLMPDQTDGTLMVDFLQQYS